MSHTPLRVLLNASALPARPAGAGVYTLELAAALRRRGDVEVVVAAPQGGDVRSPAAGPLVRSAWEQARLRGVAREAGADLIHGAHMAVPMLTGMPTVSTVHDLTFYRIPRRYPAARRWYYRALAALAREATRVIVPSKAVAGDMVRYLGYAPERIRVVAEAPRAGWAPATDIAVEQLCRERGIERPYLLCVGTAEPGKRAVDAVRALAALEEGGVRPTLVLAGHMGPLSQALGREAARLGVEERVRFLGYVPDEDLPALYTGATALVFPSLYEGFGLPPLEAMACGTPVIATGAPAMNETLGSAAMFVPLRDPGEIARAAGTLLANEAARTEWVGRGREHVRQYTWDRAAAETVEVYREVAA